MERLGFFSEKLMNGMAKSGWSQKTTAVRPGCSYEYVRKMIRGESLPAPTLLKKALSLFRSDATKIEKLVLLDRCRRHMGRPSGLFSATIPVTIALIYPHLLQRRLPSSPRPTP
jgi:hypothetical protein